MDEALTSGLKSGLNIFDIVADGNTPAASYSVTATPETGLSGRCSISSSESGDIHITFPGSPAPTGDKSVGVAAPAANSLLRSSNTPISCRDLYSAFTFTDTRVFSQSRLRLAVSFLLVEGDGELFHWLRQSALLHVDSRQVLAFVILCAPLSSLLVDDELPRSFCRQGIERVFTRQAPSRRQCSDRPPCLASVASSAPVRQTFP